jgi:GINS complex subunit 2
MSGQDGRHLEFNAEQTTVTVIVNFREDVLHLIAGSVGPFRPSLPVDVPLWLALHLKKARKCQGC